MTIDQIIGIVGQAATWITVVFVFLTLREMEKQRRATQKPELIIPKVRLYGCTRRQDEFFVPEIWSNSELNQVETYVSYLVDATIYNVGFGAAKDIRLEWSLDLQCTLQTIKDYCYKNIIPIAARAEGEILIVEFKDISSASSMKNSASHEHEYLMPASTDSQGLKTPIPAHYMHLLPVYVCILMHQLNREAKNSIGVLPSFEFPAMNLRLTYKDISNAVYSKKFNVRFDFSFMQHPLLDKEETARERAVHGWLEFVEHQ
jgi:hypothetical protein